MKALPPEFLPQIVALASCNGVVKKGKPDTRVMPMFFRETGTTWIVVVQLGSNGQYTMARTWQIGRNLMVVDLVHPGTEPSDDDIEFIRLTVVDYLASTEVFTGEK